MTAPPLESVRPPRTEAHLGDGHPEVERRGLNLVAAARPYFGLIVLTSALLSVLGVVAMLHMPSGIYPEVAFPRITVVAQTPGLAVKDVEISITRPIEEQVSIVLGVIRVRAKSVRGASELSVDFAPGTNMIQALNDVRARMAELGSQLPAGTSTIVERQTPSIFPIISFVVTGAKDPSALYDYAYYDLRPRISRIPNVSYVTVQGGDIREIVVEVDPKTLVAANLSIADVADRLGREHRLKAVGRLDQGILQYQVLADTVADAPLDLENVVIVEKNGQPLRVRDLGRVIVSHEDRTKAIRSDGKNAVALTVFRQPGGNALAISSALNAVLADAKKSSPSGIEITPVYDQGNLVRTAVANVRDAILYGALFSVLILLLFLKSIRATLIASLAIPLSLLISFVFLYLMGDTLNLMSLGGLAIAIGLIIDDTVVVIENISRHLAAGETGDAAVDRASKEISGAVIGSTFTTILVFLPLAFVHGVIGQFFQSLSLALSVSLLVSMVVSLTIIPVLASRFLARRAMPTTGPIYAVFANGYEGLLRAGLRFPRFSVVLALLMVFPVWWLSQSVKTGFMPDMDEGAFVVDYWMPVGTSLSQTDKVARRVEAILLQNEAVAGYIRRTGAELGLYATEPHRGDILVSLKPSGEREKMQEIMDDIEGKIKSSVPELASLELVPLVRDQINDLSGVDKPIEIKIFGPDFNQIRELAEKAGKIAEKTPGVGEVKSNVELGNPDIVVRTKSAEAARLGLTQMDVEAQLNAALYGQVATTLPEQDRMTKIRVRYPNKVRYNRKDLAKLPISYLAAAPATTPASAANAVAPAPGVLNFVPLEDLATIDVKRSANEKWRENQQPVITVQGELKEGADLAGVNKALAAQMADVSFPPGYRWELAGTYRATQESFSSLLTVMVVASALVFLLLGLQFKSVILPLLIFLAQPISLAAALFALWITNTPLNVSSFMGAILLIGLDVKNGIILIEYIGQLRAGGMELHEALLVAGRTRFRPILMTSLTAIFGLVPLALGHGPGAQMQQPLAIAVIGGLTANMLVTRLLVPIGYQVIQGRQAEPAQKAALA
ncbi:MAG TPA: efflux RND transporter permease subunit [Planctomycetaceae bacterium]|nr:efflux RND transporter permease subunit [Planctomycetaceae bacterium]